MQNAYYFLASLLPELTIGYPPDMSFSSLCFMLKTNLLPDDFKKSVVIRRYYDIQNIRAFWLGEKLDSRGCLNENELEEALLTRSFFPEYVVEFLEKYDSQESRLRYFSALVSAYFVNEIREATGFLKRYLTFEREWRLVFTGFRAKQLGRNLLEELQFEDSEDEIVRQIVAQKDAKSYEPPSRYSQLTAIFESNRDSPQELHRALCEYRFHVVESMYGTQLFSIDRILAYMVQLAIVEKWLELDKKKGLEVLEGVWKV